MNYEPFLGMNVLVSKPLIEQITYAMPFVLIFGILFFFITFLLIAVRFK